MSIALPPQSLSSRVAQARQQDQVVLKPELTTSFDAYTRDYSHFDLRDWSAFLATSPSKEIVEGKKATLSGFIFRNQDGSLSIARFRLSCCAVDATPLTIPILPSPQADVLQIDKWYELTGSFIYDQSAQSYELNIESVNPIEVPREQYVY